MSNSLFLESASVTKQLGVISWIFYFSNIRSALNESVFNLFPHWQNWVLNTPEKRSLLTNIENYDCSRSVVFDNRSEHLTSQPHPVGFSNILLIGAFIWHHISSSRSIGHLKRLVLIFPQSPSDVLCDIRVNYRYLNKMLTCKQH